MSFLQQFAYRYICPYLWWMVFLSCVGATVVNVHKYYIQLEEKSEEIRLATVRYNSLCLDPKQIHTIRYESRCDIYKKQQSQNPYWEAFVIIASKWQLCDPDTGCSASIYIVIGIVIGAILLLWGLNKAPKRYMEYIDQLNAEEDANFIHEYANRSLFDGWDISMPNFFTKESVRTTNIESKKKLC